MGFTKKKCTTYTLYLYFASRLHNFVLAQDHINLLLISLSIPPLLTSKQCAEVGEVALEGDADTLSGECGLGEVTVVGLTVSTQTDVATRREEVTYVEVTYEIGGVSGTVTITKVAVDE